jgi:hypothetical protein
MKVRQSPTGFVAQSQGERHMLLKRIPVFIVILAIALLSGQCGKDEGPTQTQNDITDPLDTIPPAAISDLLTKIPTANSIYLQWTAPGDDGMEGTADSYDVRYHSEQITELNWEDATKFDGEPVPNPAGQNEAVNISGLDVITTYFFAVKSTDDAGNTSELSNSTSETTLNEAIAPVVVTDLEAVAIGEYSFRLTWTAPGDDGIVGTASEYEIRYSMQPITAANWASATEVGQPPAPKPGGEPETLVVSQIRAPQNHYFAMKAADEVPNWSDMSNVAFGLGFGVQLYLMDRHIQVGEELTFLFRAPPGGALVTVNLNRYGIMGCDPTHTWVHDWIVPSAPYPEGIHEVTYDFMKNNGTYLPPATYYVVLCWDWEFETSSVVYLENSP